MEKYKIHSVMGYVEIKNRDTPKSSILIGFSIKKKTFWGKKTIFGSTPICSDQLQKKIGAHVVWLSASNGLNGEFLGERLTPAGRLTAIHPRNDGNLQGRCSSPRCPWGVFSSAMLV